MPRSSARFAVEMKVVSVNVGQPRELYRREEIVRTSLQSAVQTAGEATIELLPPAVYYTNIDGVWLTRWQAASPSSRPALCFCCSPGVVFVLHSPVR